MPTREAIVDSVIPKEVEKPIPTRTVLTRTPSINRDQPTTTRSDSGAEPAQAAESVRLSPQLSALARKEQAFRQKEHALKQREKDLETKLKDAETFQTFKSKLSAKDFSEAEAMGLNYEEYTQYLLKKEAGETPEAKRIKALEEQIAALAKGQEENADQVYESTVAEYRKEIASFIGSTPGYEGLKDPETQKAVLQLILDDFEKEDKETSIQEAASDVKAYLAEQAQKLSVFLEKKEPEEKPLPPPVKTSGLKTLTQQVTTGAAAAPLKSLQHLSESERYAEARRRALAKRQTQEGNR